MEHLAWLAHDPAMHEWLEPWRKKSGRTLEQVAEALSVSSATISRWENGIVSPKIEQLIELAALYGCDPLALFFDPEKPEAAEALRSTHAMIVELGVENSREWFRYGEYLLSAAKMKLTPDAK